MRIDTLHVKNFKCFEDAQWNFTPGFNILIGDNGAGKTSILEALRISVGSFFHAISDIPCPMIENSHPRIYSQYSDLEDPEKNYCFPVEIDTFGDFSLMINDGRYISVNHPIEIAKDHLEYYINLKKINWIRSKSSLKNATTYKNLRELNYYVDIMKNVKENIKQVFPLISYYSTSRRQLKRRAKSTTLFKRGDFRRGYEGALDIASNEVSLWTWLRTMELEWLQSGSPSATLESVRQSALSCMQDEGFTWVGYSIKLREIAVKDKDGNLIPVSFLSDGQVTILEMVLDMARRAVLLNPFLQERAAQETPGVVLIDELELHLHPTWQRRIVNDLRRTFPLVQFIATTHAPLILQSLSPETDQIIQLLGSDGKHNIIVPDPRKTPEELLEDPMETPLTQRSHASQERFRVAQEYYRLLRGAEGASPEKIQAVKEQLDILMIPYYDNEAYAAYVSFLREERIASGIDGLNGEGKNAS
jgi:predicted ATP-binding protein involved in virulence